MQNIVIALHLQEDVDPSSMGT